MRLRDGRDVGDVTVSDVNDLMDKGRFPEVVAQAFGRSEFFSVPELTFCYLRSLGTALISYAGLGLQSVNYMTLPWGQRGTVLLAPAVLDGAIMIVIRKHSPVVRTLEDLE